MAISPDAMGARLAQLPRALPTAGGIEWEWLGRMMADRLRTGLDEKVALKVVTVVADRPEDLTAVREP